MNWNIHTHTTRCRHADGSDEDYILTAIDAGYTALGFSDHAPMPFSEGYYSTMRMYPEQLPEYICSLTALRERYGDRIELKIGLEVEYYPGLFSDFLRLIAPYPVEYLLLGQHFLYDEIGSPWMGRPTDDPNHLRAFVQQSCDGMKTGLFTYLAHPDLIWFTGDESLYHDQMALLCQTAKETNTPLELNINGALKDRNYPDPRFWQIAADSGCTCIIGCDAHSPDALLSIEAEQRCRAIAESCGILLAERVPLVPPF